MSRDLSIQKVGKHGCNTTSLNIEKSFERSVFHRDMFAHWLRYQHIAKIAKPNEEYVLDVGCGEGNLAMALYANRLCPKLYVGLELRKTMVEKNKQRKFNFPAEFYETNICDGIPSDRKFSIITCTEVLEHIPPEKVIPVLQSMKAVMADNSKLIISTPCFNGKTKADNHVKEYTFDEMYCMLNMEFSGDEFSSIDTYGTFISLKDFERKATSAQLSVYNELKPYYNVNVLSILLAPLQPEVSRNCLWVITKGVK